MILYISFEKNKKRVHCLYAASNDLEMFIELKCFGSKEELLIWLDLNMSGFSCMPMKNVKLSWVCKVYDSVEICMDDVQAKDLCRLCLGNRKLLCLDI